jgi:23S rRNA (cytidine1920-2'-O)/16S rRNA (cytidine1409-2'-O)-methyltransferase
MAKARIDQLLVARGLVDSRARAQAMVLAGNVFVGGARIDKAGTMVPEDAAIDVRGAEHPYVSRGGVKLAGALDAFAIDVTGLACLDVGASTGGFTDCLLRRGAAHVVAIDVGRGQLAWTLRNDERVTVMERTNVRELDARAVDPPADLCVADLSFISLRTVAPNLLVLTTPSAGFVLLVKPQFEAGRARIGKGGIVRDPVVHAAVLRDVVSGLDASGLGIDALAVSPLRGADGNIEFFAHARRGPATVDETDIDRVVTTAHGAGT